MSNFTSSPSTPAIATLVQRRSGGAEGEEKAIPQIVTIRSRNSSADSSASGLDVKTPRTATPKTARFIEATSVNSPIEPKKNPFKGPPISITTTHLQPQLQPADIGFGLMSSDEIKHTSVEMPMTPLDLKTPMKSALKVPGTPGRFLDPRSPTFHEEVALEKEEMKTEKQNARDFKQKKRVRIAKFFLRGVNFSCALIVLSMLSTSLTIFNATKTIPARSNLPPWALGQQIWPQIVLLVVSSVSLAICCFIFYSYWKGGHRKAKRTQIYYTAFSLGIFLFSTVMWIFAAAVLHSTHSNGNGQDFWGWSCNDNKRATLFQDEINYTLVCRLQNWSLICCLIEVVIETITISIYIVVLWRIMSKRRLHKSMNNRDKARSDLYLAQLRIQSAPNTPGFIKSSTAPTFPKHLHDEEEDDDSFDEENRITSASHAVVSNSNSEKGGKSGPSVTVSEADWARRHQETFAPVQHHLPVPAPHATPGLVVTSATPVMGGGEWEAPHHTTTEQEHMGAAPGEKSYAAVPIPGAY